MLVGLRKKVLVCVCVCVCVFGLHGLHSGACLDAVGTTCTLVLITKPVMCGTFTRGSAFTMGSVSTR